MHQNIGFESKIQVQIWDLNPDTKTQRRESSNLVIQVQPPNTVPLSKIKILYFGESMNEVTVSFNSVTEDDK